MGADYYEQFEECEAYADCLPLGVGKGTHIKGAIVDKNARIGKFCKIINAEGIQVGQCPRFPLSGRLSFGRVDGRCVGVGIGRFCKDCNAASGSTRCLRCLPHFRCLPARPPHIPWPRCMLRC